MPCTALDGSRCRGTPTPPRHADSPADLQKEVSGIVGGSPTIPCATTPSAHHKHRYGEKSGHLLSDDRLTRKPKPPAELAKRKELVMTDRLYRVRITSYPQGSYSLMVLVLPEGLQSHWVPASGWAPPGWTPSATYQKTYGHKFVWPSTNTLYHTLSSARRRARLLESYGASVAIDTSSEISWPPSPPIEAQPPNRPWVMG